MIVVDASVLAGALTDDGRFGRACRTELAEDTHWSAPDHLVVEVLSAIRGRYLGARITDQRAEEALQALATAIVDRVDIVPVLPRMWALHRNLSGYDAAYVCGCRIPRLHPGHGRPATEFCPRPAVRGPGRRTLTCRTNEA